MSFLGRSGSWRRRLGACASAVAAVVLTGLPVAPSASANGPVTYGSYVDSSGTVYSLTSASPPVAISRPGFTAPNAAVASVQVSTGFFTFVVDSAGSLGVIATDGSTSPVSPPGVATPGQPLFATTTADRAVSGFFDTKGVEHAYDLITRDVNVPKGQPKPPGPPPGTPWPELARTFLAWYQPGISVVAQGDEKGDFAMFATDRAGNVHGVWQDLTGQGVDRVLVNGAAVGATMSVTRDYAAGSLPTAISLFFVTPGGSVGLLHPAVGGGLAAAPTIMPWGAPYLTTATGHLAASTDGTQANVAYLTDQGAVADLSLDANGQWQSAVIVTAAGAGWRGASAAAAQIPGQINVLCGAAASGQPAWVAIVKSAGQMIPTGPQNVTADTRFTAG